MSEQKERPPAVPASSLPAEATRWDCRIDDYLDHLYALLVGQVPYPRRVALRAELRSHLEALLEASEEVGLEPGAAVEAALKQFGEPEALAREWLATWRQNMPPPAPWAAAVAALGCFGLTSGLVIALVLAGVALPAVVLWLVLPLLTGMVAGLLAPERPVLGTFLGLAGLILLTVIVGSATNFQVRGANVSVLGLVQGILWLPAGCAAAGFASCLKRRSTAASRWGSQAPRASLLLSVCFALSLVRAEAAAPLVRPLTGADAAVAHGSVTYEVRPFYPQADAAANQAYTLSVTYTADGRFRQTRQPTGSSAGLSATEVNDGRRNLLVSPASVTANGPETSSPRTAVQPWLRLVPGPCAVMGRGLSRLDGVRLVQSGPVPVVEGEAPDGSILHAVLDPQHGWIARRIERRAEGHMIARWSLVAPVKTADGVWLPAQGIFRAFGLKGDLVATDRYRLVHADFGVPATAAFAVSVAGKQLIDSRSGMSVGLTPGRTPLSLEEGLTETQRTGERIATMRADEAEETRKEATRRMSVTFLLLAIGWAFLWGLLQLLRQRTAY